MSIEILDCTLRDGAYICNSNFGTVAIKGIIRKCQDAGIDIIECGWLKNSEHIQGSSFFHRPSDLESYLKKDRAQAVYVVMIDWDRYDLDLLPVCDGKSVDAIRVVFPHEHFKEGIAVGRQIMQKGYKVFYQAANTLAYENDELKELAEEINKVEPISLSIVDTFGAMDEEDLDRIVGILDGCLNPQIKLGFHSHNNQQLSFALSKHFIQKLKNKDRGVIVDASLCGMGRGAGNTTTELLVSYVNRKCGGHYDLDAVMDAIDTYMCYFQEKYTWGYSIPYFIAGLYECHVNNIAYLTKNHRTNAHDMRNIIKSLPPAQRRKYDYDVLEKAYIENQDRVVDDDACMDYLREELRNRRALLIAPGISSTTKCSEIMEFIKKEIPVVIAVNALNPIYEFDFLFLINNIRYDYAKNAYPEQFYNTKRIILSSIKTTAGEGEYIINFNRVVKNGWEHFDNAVIDALRLLDLLKIKEVYLAGFDGFKHKYNESYGDIMLPTLNPDNKWDELNEEIKCIYADFVKHKRKEMQIHFLTPSLFEYHEK